VLYFRNILIWKRIALCTSIFQYMCLIFDTSLYINGVIYILVHTSSIMYIFVHMSSIIRIRIFAPMSRGTNISALMSSYKCIYILVHMSIVIRICVLLPISRFKYILLCVSNVIRTYILVLMFNVIRTFDWLFMTPSIATKFQYVNSLLFSVSLTTCFGPYGPSSGGIYNYIF
jgi:hypothetical protein